MINRITAFIFIVVIIFAADTVYRYDASASAVEKSRVSKSIEDLPAPGDTDAANPNIHIRSGQIYLEKEDYANAAVSFEKAVGVRTNDYLSWTRLGYSRFKTSEFDKSRAAFDRALVLAPYYPQPNRLMGRLLLAIGEIDKGFSYLRKAAELDNNLYPEVLHLARKQFPGDGAAIERVIAPTTTESRRKVAAYLIKHSALTSESREFLLSESEDTQMKRGFVAQLIKYDQFELARDVWLTIGQNRVRSDEIKDKLIFDGGFESPVNVQEQGFGWSFAKSDNTVTVSVDTKTKLSGNGSARVIFTGGADPSQDFISQLVVLKPQKSYEIVLNVKSAAITSYGGVNFVVTDAVSKKPLGQSANFADSNGEWTKYRVTFQTESPTIQIAIRRTACKLSPCPIFADFHIDDITVRE